MGSCQYSASPSMSGLTLRRRDQSCTVSLDYLVGLSEELLWDVETQRPGGFEVDDQLEGGRLLDRHLRRIGTLEDLSGVNAHQAKGSFEARSIADEAAGSGELAPRIDRRNGMARGQRHDLLALVGEERIRADDERAGVQRDQRGEGIFDLAC